MAADAAGVIESAGGVRLVLTTLADAASAELLVRTLVEESLVACGNIVPGVASIYRWEGRVVREEEVLVVLKTAGDHVERIFERVSALHPYSVPELIGLPVEKVSEAYGRWVMESIEAGE